MIHHNRRTFRSRASRAHPSRYLRVHHPTRTLRDDAGALLSLQAHRAAHLVVAAAYVEELTRAPATVKQDLAAIRLLFDWLVVGHAASTLFLTTCARPPP